MKSQTGWVDSLYLKMANGGSQSTGDNDAFIQAVHKPSLTLRRKDVNNGLRIKGEKKWSFLIISMEKITFPR